VSGIFITFEGIDGSGKSTQLRLLADALVERGLDVVRTREPGGTPLGARLRALLLDAHEHVDPLAELLLFAADRAQHVRTVLRPALDAGRVVLSDRYSDATIAYQGAGRHFALELIAQLIAVATEGLKPDLTLLFDVPIELSLRRQRRRALNEFGRGDRLDMEDAKFRTRVRERYLKLAAEDASRIRIIDARGSIAETQARVMETVKPLLEKQYG
jgi:dTMP kinase